MIAVTPSGTLTTNVQTSLQALDTGKAPLNHTQLSSTISDSTVAGRALLTAADVNAQKLVGHVAARLPVRRRQRDRDAFAAHWLVLLRRFEQEPRHRRQPFQRYHHPAVRCCHQRIGRHHRAD
jgi:hypothetical protein